MESEWDAAIDFVLRMEGGTEAENDPKDPGGLTKYGISQKAYPNLDIRNLTLEAAKAIYRKDYWDDCHCGELPIGWDAAVLDTAVNMGASSARRMLQVAIGVEVDGVIGEKTVKAAHAASPRKLTRFLSVRLAEYARRIVAKPDLQYWSYNWFHRVMSLHEFVLYRSWKVAP